MRSKMISGVFYNSNYIENLTLETSKFMQQINRNSSCNTMLLSL